MNVLLTATPLIIQDGNTIFGDVNDSFLLDDNKDDESSKKLTSILCGILGLIWWFIRIWYRLD